ncbi:auxin-responsive protein SAUR40-like [Punica granatum]|uniref:Uncharacterized protein n=2 Tax=Punica granatum TaxID=22663 RepID=A0A218WLP1_PUNGR|nr:auxin-responsive protein SAUR40-like [Punica granatum]XP_031376232.1 auxin-responsive protein SAUR40-like [Punica granatum]XP_031376233.1 auxin-responsive protein SAUR40-like [Punica granatum]XP_031386616.1 auxin-responsive protein SAUR40-like [Punica granatum]XP_031388829.1 auxin-responsive protein SAUR40-like [Punica granatum]OWM73767.1 hypothetical protein CDL15_Pgr026871 [Punica granatum]PKI64615.1 hypothetical protein CRG98_015047 [Punica granatum]
MKNKPAGIVKLKTAVGKLNKISLLLGRKQESYDDFEDRFGDSQNVPEDVKEGHFAVIAVDGEQLKRFVVPLSCLTHPRFVRLLEQAAEEYGFDHGGALAIPCRLSELERILAEGVESGDSSDEAADWVGSSKTTVQMNELLVKAV